MANTIPVPEEITTGENVLVKLPVPMLPVEFGGEGVTPQYSLSFINLDDQTTFPVEGDIEDDDTVKFFWDSGSMTVGAYAWRYNYQADTGMPEHEVADVFNGTFTQPNGRPYEFQMVGTGIDIPQHKHWEFTLPGIEAPFLIETDDILALTASAVNDFYDFHGTGGFIQIGVSDNIRHGIGRTSDNKLLYYTAFRGDYDIRIRQRTDIPVIVKKVISRGYTVVTDDVTHKEHERTMITLLENILEDRLKKRSDIISYSIEGRNLMREPIDEIYFMLSRYKEAYAAKKRGGRPEHRLSYAETFGRGHNHKWR